MLSTYLQYLLLPSNEKAFVRKLEKLEGTWYMHATTPVRNKIIFFGEENYTFLKEDRHYFLRNDFGQISISKGLYEYAKHLADKYFLSY